MPPLSLSLAEFAAIAAVTPGTARRWVSQGLVEAWRAGPRGRFRVPVAAAATFLGTTEAQISAWLSRRTAALVRDVEREIG